MRPGACKTIHGLAFGPLSDQQSDMTAPPTVSVVFLSYNQERYVEDALRSVLDQDYPALQIVVSDDCSTDGSMAIIDRLIDAYRGPHQVHVRRNGRNQGIVENIRTAFADATGTLVVFAAGDDVSLPHRVSRLTETWQAEGGGTTVLYSDYLPISPSGEPLEGATPQIYRGPHRIESMADGTLRVLGATSAITRDLVTGFAPMIPSARYEDRVFPFRALLAGGKVLFVDAQLIRYRLDIGVSQQRARDARHFLGAHSLAQEQLRLADAIQRLCDLMTVRPQNDGLRRRCQRTIATHETRIAFAKGGRAPEALLWNGLLRGGSRIAAVKLYGKHRFYPVARQFIRI